MKRNILAVIIPTLLAASVSIDAAEVYNKDGSRLDMYGRIKAAHSFEMSGDSGKDKTPDSGDSTNFRLGFIGETAVTDSLLAYAKAEWQKGTTDNTSELRYGFVGLQYGKYGAIDYGKNGGVIKRVFDYTDVLPEFGGDSGSTLDQVVPVLSGRKNAVITYRNTDLFGYVDGLDFDLQYRAEQDLSSSEEARLTQFPGDTIRYQNREAFGANLEYDIFKSGASVIAGYSRAASGPYTLAFGAKYDGAKYNLDSFYVAALYSQTNANDLKQELGWHMYRQFEVVMQYGIDLDIGKVIPSVAYIYGTGIDNPNGTDENDVVKYVEMGLTYEFTRNISAIVDYKLNLIDDQNDLLALGLIYRF